MNKYIDAEKLITKIKARQLELVEHIKTDTPSEKAIDGSKTVELQWILDNIDSLQQETSEISLEKFTEKMNAWKASYNSRQYSCKATMAFTARMFYMYPDVARQWYDSLPKAIPD